MKYYKVKSSSDQTRIAIRTISGFLIGGELYTENELNRAIYKGRMAYLDKVKHFTEVFIRKNNVYWSFGAI